MGALLTGGLWLGGVPGEGGGVCAGGGGPHTNTRSCAGSITFIHTHCAATQHFLCAALRSVQGQLPGSSGGRTLHPVQRHVSRLLLRPRAGGRGRTEAAGVCVCACVCVCARVCATVRVCVCACVREHGGMEAFLQCPCALHVHHTAASSVLHTQLQTGGGLTLQNNNPGMEVALRFFHDIAPYTPYKNPTCSGHNPVFQAGNCLLTINWWVRARVCVFVGGWVSM